MGNLMSEYRPSIPQAIPLIENKDVELHFIHFPFRFVNKLDAGKYRLRAR